MNAFQIRPIRETDAGAIKWAYEHDLSPESRRLRFHGGGRELPEATVHYLTHVDGIDHVALVAVETGPLGPGAGLGVARFVRTRDAPSRAELAVAVIDRAQRQGVARELVRMLARAALERGIHTFTMFVLGENHRVAHVLESLHAHGHAEGGALDYEIAVEALLGPESATLTP